MRGILTLPAGRPAENSSGVLYSVEPIAWHRSLCAQEQRNKKSPFNAHNPPDIQVLVALAAYKLRCFLG